MLRKHRFVKIYIYIYIYFYFSRYWKQYRVKVNGTGLLKVGITMTNQKITKLLKNNF